jgi:hypothetical protein
MLAFMKTSALIWDGSLVSCSNSKLAFSAYVDRWKKANRQELIVHNLLVH